MPERELARILGKEIPQAIGIAHEAYGMYQAITDRHESLNGSSWQLQFGLMQRGALATFILSICAIFEEEQAKYPNLGIPKALDLLAQLGPPKQFSNAPALVDFTESKDGKWLGLDLNRHFGTPKGRSEAFSLMLDSFRSRLPNWANSPKCPADEALDALKVLRDKRIAHLEDHDLTGLATTTFPQALELLVYARALCLLMWDCRTSPRPGPLPSVDDFSPKRTRAYIGTVRLVEMALKES